MKPTRVPYEESSVFSEWDVRSIPEKSRVPSPLPSPDLDITLQPGDVLFVPWQWWHDVECVSDEPALSANIWLAHSSSSDTGDDDQSDALSRVNEAMVRVVVSALIDRARGDAERRPAKVRRINKGKESEGWMDLQCTSEEDERWVNPTEVIAPHDKNLHMLRTALLAHASAGFEGKDGTEVAQNIEKVDEEDIIAVLLSPSAVKAATGRLLRRLR